MLPESTHIGGVKLRVASLTRSLEFYGTLLGLQPGAISGGRVALSAPQSDSPLVELVELPGAIQQPMQAAGLYHTAFLLPRRSDLGHALRRLAQSGWPLQGASDHAVSEALYLADPDGNGVEIYADRPREIWPRANNEIGMTTQRLDVESLLAESDADAQTSGSEWSGFPAGSTVGHIHLRVPSIEDGRILFVDIIGMDVTASRYPGALFMSAGGYHHHVAVNVWEGRNIPPLPANAAGLIDFEVVVPDAAAISAIAGRAAAAGIASETVDGEVVLIHAGGIRVVLTARDDVTTGGSAHRGRMKEADAH
jgi:catechol 2,3-dioxygenase